MNNVRLRSRKQPVKVIDNIPGGYNGKVYYRLVYNHTVVESRRFKTKVPADEDRWDDFAMDQVKLREAIRDGFFCDADGTPSARYQRPLRLTAQNEEEPDAQFGGLVTSWAYDIIRQMDPSGHIFLPVDVERPSGSVLRLWGHLFADNWLDEPPYLVDPVANNLKPVTYTSGKKGFHKPRWVRSGYTTFGYLREDAINGRHLFASNMVDNASVISSELFECLNQRVDAFGRAVTLYPVGSI